MASSNLLSPAQRVAEIDDLLNRILRRLPVETLGRFKSVSKQWLSLISTQSGVATAVPALLRQGEFDTQLRFVPLDPTKPTTKRPIKLDHKSVTSFRPEHSCNGLLLWSFSVLSSRIPLDYHVYNPFTFQSASLPPLDASPIAATLAYDPSVSRHFKVVCLCGDYSIKTGIYYEFIRYSVPIKIMIYDSQTCCWRVWDDSSFEPGIGLVGHCSDRRSNTNGVYWNGSVYYVSDVIGDYALHRFDIEQERIEDVCVPGGGFGASPFKYLKESWNRLYLMSYADTEGRELCIYEMERGCVDWCLKYQLDSFGFDLESCYIAPNVDTPDDPNVDEDTHEDPPGRDRDGKRGSKLDTLEVRVPPCRNHDGTRGSVEDMWVFCPQPEIDDEKEPFLIITTSWGIVRYDFRARIAVNIYHKHPLSPFLCALPWVQNLALFS